MVKTQIQNSVDIMRGNRKIVRKAKGMIQISISNDECDKFESCVYIFFSLALVSALCALNCAAKPTMLLQSTPHSIKR